MTQIQPDFAAIARIVVLKRWKICMAGNLISKVLSARTGSWPSGTVKTVSLLILRAFPRMISKKSDGQTDSHRPLRGL